MNSNTHFVVVLPFTWLYVHSFAIYEVIFHKAIYVANTSVNTHFLILLLMLSVTLNSNYAVLSSIVRFYTIVVYYHNYLIKINHCL